jgi:hypothetical protein
MENNPRRYDQYYGSTDKGVKAIFDQGMIALDF